MNIAQLLVANLRRQSAHVVFAASGIALGAGALVFFVALSVGVKVHLLDRVVPAHQVELVPRSVQVGLFERQGGLFGAAPLDEALVARLAAVRGVEQVWPRQQVSFPALAEGGEGVIGQTMYTELLADGIPPHLVADRHGPDAGANAFVDWEGERRCAGGVDDAAGGGVAGDGVAGDGAGCAPSERCEAGRCVARACEPEDEIWIAPTRADAQRVVREIGQRFGRGVRADVREVRGRWHVTVRGAALEEVLFRLPLDELVGEPLDDLRPSCPEPAWCDASRRRCAMPVPMLVSPTMLELYNGNVQSMMSGMAGNQRLPRLSEDALIGLRVDVTLGQGIVGRARGVVDGGVAPERVQLRLVGFSEAAMPIGATVPIDYVRRWNARYNGQDAGETYHSLLVQARDGAALQRATTLAVDELGLDVHPRYVRARQASGLLSLIAGVFVLLSLFIIGLAALNVLHTFLMQVAERRGEIGVLRALGARRGTVAWLIVNESLVIALMGWVVGVGVALGLGWLTTRSFVALTPDFPFKPEALFVYPWWLLVGSLGVALLFAAVGALLPASRAARLDPAEALRD